MSFKCTNTATLQLQEIRGTMPTRAILLHRWREHSSPDDESQSIQEIVFSDLHSSVGLASLNHPPLASSQRKLLSACDQARIACIRWLWADTACIDKSSSIDSANVPYRWYRRAEICSANLGDVAS